MDTGYAQAAMATQFGHVMASDAPVEPELNKALGQIEVIDDFVRSVGHDIAQFLDRANGPHPEAAAKNTVREAHGPGTVGQLRSRLDDVTDALHGLRALSERLSRIP